MISRVIYVSSKLYSLSKISKIEKLLMNVSLKEITSTESDAFER